ncbi:unnamed protein product [Ectocarpus sp. 6 AP-2014]
MSCHILLAAAAVPSAAQHSTATSTLPQASSQPLPMAAVDDRQTVRVGGAARKVTWPSPRRTCGVCYDYDRLLLGGRLRFRLLSSHLRALHAHDGSSSYCPVRCCTHRRLVQGALLRPTEVTGVLFAPACSPLPIAGRAAGVVKGHLVATDRRLHRDNLHLARGGQR